MGREKRSRFLVLAGIALLAFVVRVPDLGRQSPWLDEIANWLVAAHYSFEGQRTHTVSYALMRAGLGISDSAFGLRLFSALFGFLSVIVATAWAIQRRGRLVAALLGGGLALSPFHVFYSQDANHYGVLLLLGTLGAVGVDWYLQRPRPSWLGLFSLAGASLLAAGSHPLGVIAGGGAGLVVLAWVFRNTERLPPKGRAVTVWRAVLMVVFLAGCAVAIPRGWDRLLAAAGVEHSHARNFGLNAEFWRALLGDLYGAFFHHELPDTILGLTGLLLSAFGMGLLARQRPWACAGSCALIVVTILPFLLVSYSHYFAPRYFAALLPALAIGAAEAIAHVIRQARRQPDWLRRAVGMAAIAWMALFLVRFGVWEVARLRHDHQPSIRALEWVRDRTPRDAILMTRHRYSSRAVRFLWNRMDMGDRRHVALSFIYRFPQPSLQQAEELAAEFPGKVYYLSLIESEERLTREFSDWLDESTELVADFPSGSPDEFVPIDWGVRVRRVLPPNGDPLSLPRSGTRASGLMNEERLTPGRGNLLSPGTGAWYRYRLDDPAPGLVVRVILAAEGQAPAHLVLGVPGGPHGMVSARPEEEAKLRTYILPGPFEAGEGRLDLTLASSGSSPASRALVMEIAPWHGEDGERVEVLEPVGQVGMGAPARFSHPSLGPLLEVRRTTPGGAKVVAVQRFQLDGLGDRALLAEVESGDARRSLIPQIQWTSGEATAAAVIESDGQLVARYRIGPQWGFRPFDPEVVVEPLDIYVPAPE